MSNFEIKKATRQGIKPLIGIYSESGCGKTMSGLLLARGMVGPSGKIVLCDTESGRGSLYADVIPGGYETIQLKPPFAPARHIELIQAVEDAGADIGMLDSGSHEWESIGGVLDMAAEAEQKMGKNLGTWRVPKMEHAKFLNRLVQSSIPWIVCLRAKYKTRQTTGTQQMADAGVIQSKDIGKKVVLKDEITTPIQADDFIFEMTVHFEILQKHTIIVSKCSHPALRDCLPADRERPIEIKDGEALARWCASGGTQTSTGASTGTAGASPTIATVKELKKTLWDLLVNVRGQEKNWLGAEQWLAGHKIITDSQTVAALTPEQLLEVIDKTKIVIKEQGQP